MSTGLYEYKVRDRRGGVVTGKLEGASQEAVVARLQGMGYAPISVRRRGAGLDRELSLPRLGAKVKLKDLAVFARQFATMIDSGLSLLRALSILADQSANKELAKVLTAVRQDIEAGRPLSSAMTKHPDVFPPLMVNMTKAGELGGFLDGVMLQLAKNYEAEVRLRSKVKSAMTYPTVVFVLAILMCVAMLLFIVPTFASMFSTLGGDLPGPTKVLVALSGLLRTFALPLLLLVVVGFGVWARVRHKQGVRDVVDPLKLKVPVFGPLFRKIALARFSRNLGTMLSSGVPILSSLDIVADATGNAVLARAVRDVQDSVRTGRSLSQPLQEHSVFPSMVVQMMAVGEDTGALDTMLGKIAEFYDQEVEATTEALTSLIEPLMIVILGGVIGSMILALYMPIFKVFDLVQ
jgi:type IV pilus assembly protein PilC